MPIATPQGTLDFKSVDKVTFVGASSNTVIDTTTGSLGVGVGVGGPTSNLHVVGNTRLEGDINMLHTANTASIKLNSNVVAEFPRSKKLIKYPRVALTADAETESGYNGYKVERSSVADSQYAAWKAFNNINGLPTGDYPWISENSPDGYTTATGLPTGNNGDVFQTVNGAWLSIELPHNIKLSYMMLSNRNDNSSGIRPPKDIVVWGSLDGTTWTSLKTYTNTNVSQAATYKVDINSTSYYKHFRLHILSVHGYDAVAIGEWELYGTPEYDPEAHGTDVTVKSVANVPNTDWLEVYYDAKDLATGAVTNVDDLTPSGTNDGTATNVTVSDGAFVFNGSSYLETDIPQITTGVWPFTMSFWFKVNAHIGTTWNYLAHLGIRGTNGDSTLVGLRNDQISITTWGDSKINSGVVATPGVWYHVTSTWPGGAFYDNAKLYINAVSYGDVDNTRDEVNPLSFPTSGNKLTLGKQMNTTSDYFNGSIANFRLFNRALTQDEIYQLYAYQKEDFGHGDLSMTLKAGRLGIGTSEPRAALDVRGRIMREYNPGEVIEELHSVCNTTSLRGRATIQNVTASVVTSSDSYSVITGSYVQNYVPPIGTKHIVYEFTYMIGRQDAHSIATLKLYFKKGVGWLEVTKARQLNSGDDRQNKYAHRWVFEVGASSDDNTLGIMTEERPSLSIQMQIRRHNSSHDSILHSTDYWDGSGTDQYSQPMIMIKAIA